MSLIWLSGVDVVEDTLLEPGRMIRLGAQAYVHPLDIIAMTAPHALDRLSLAMSWLVAQADRKFDAAIRRLQ